MNSKIKIGQYIPTNSFLHKLDPRIKIISLIILLVALFLIPVSTAARSLIMIGFMLVISFLLNVIAKVPIRKILLGLRPLVFLLTFTFIIQLFTITSGNSIFKEALNMSLSVSSLAAIIVLIIFYNMTKKMMPLKTIYFFVIIFLIFYMQKILPYGNLINYKFNPTYDGVIRGAFLFVRIMATVLLTSLLTFTTMTTDLNYGFESVLKPLKIIRVPVESIAMMLSLILRYIPTLLFETEKIMKAQASRGLDFKESKLREKIKQVIALLVPIFLISINRAEDLSDAMIVRGYVIGQKRSRIDEYKLSLRDYLSFIFVVLLLISIIVIKVIY